MGLAMNELISYIAKSLVDHPESVDVQEKEDIGNNSIIFELKVAKEDLGKVIGRQGRTAHAMRTLLSAMAGKEQKQAILKIME